MKTALYAASIFFGVIGTICFAMITAAYSYGLPFYTFLPN